MTHCPELRPPRSWGSQVPPPTISECPHLGLNLCLNGPFSQSAEPGSPARAHRLPRAPPRQTWLFCVVLTSVLRRPCISFA